MHSALALPNVSYQCFSDWILGPGKVNRQFWGHYRNQRAETRTPTKGTVLLFPCLFCLSFLLLLSGALLCSSSNQLACLLYPEIEGKKRLLNSQICQNVILCRPMTLFLFFITALLKYNSHVTKLSLLSVQLGGFTLYTLLYNHPRYVIQELFHHPQKKAQTD